MLTVEQFKADLELARAVYGEEALNDFWLTTTFSSLKTYEEAVKYYASFLSIENRTQTPFIRAARIYEQELKEKGHANP